MKLFDTIFIPKGCTRETLDNITTLGYPSFKKGDVVLNLSHDVKDTLNVITFIDSIVMRFEEGHLILNI